MIFVLAEIELKEGTREAFLAEFHRIVPLVRGEQGCIEYGPTVDVDVNLPVVGEPRLNVVTVVEKWDSIAALEAHLVAPHMMEYRPKVKDFVSKVSLRILEPA